MKTAIKRSYNRYDTMVSLIIISLAIGYLGGFYNPVVKLLVFLFIPFLLKNMKGKTLIKVRPFVIAFVFWGIYNTLSILWTPRIGLAISHSLLYLVNFIMFLEIIVFSEKASSIYKSIAFSWLIAFFLTSLVAIWELKTGNHLSNAKSDYLGRGDEMEDLSFGTFVAVGFYNLNTFCIYILEVFPFVLYTMAAKIKKKWKFLALYCGLMCILFVLVNGSRGSILALALMFLVFCLFIVRDGRKGMSIALILIGILVFLLVSYGDILLAVLMFRMENSGMFEDNSRIVLWEKSLELFINTCGIGTGVGSMVPSMEAQGNSYSIYYSHNLFIELLMQFGVVITLLVCYYFYNLWVKTRKMINVPNKILLYAALTSLPLYSIVNSEYVHIHFVWCYFATLYVYTYSSRKQQICQHGKEQYKVRAH